MVVKLSSQVLHSLSIRYRTLQFVYKSQGRVTNYCCVSSRKYQFNRKSCSESPVSGYVV